MNDLYFLGMDVVEETKTLVDFMAITCTNGMTDDQLRAYRLGIESAISALKSTLQNDDMAVVNIDGLEIPTELSVDEVETYYANLY